MKKSLLKLYQSQKEKIYHPTKVAIDNIAINITFKFIDLSPVSTGNLVSAWQVSFGNRILEDNGILRNNTKSDYAYYWSQHIRILGSVSETDEYAKNNVSEFNWENRTLLQPIHITNGAKLNDGDYYAYGAITKKRGAFSGTEDERIAVEGMKGFDAKWNFITKFSPLK